VLGELSVLSEVCVFLLVIFCIVFVGLLRDVVLMICLVFSL